MPVPAPGVSTRLLYPDSPLIILPQLATLIGADEAVMLQQIHYWIKIAGKERDGRLWIYNSQAAWAAQFPFWKRGTVRRVLRNLEARGLVLTARYNTLAFDRTKWYAIDYAAVAALLDMADPAPPWTGEEPPLVAADQRLVAADQRLVAADQRLVAADQRLAGASQPIPETTPEITPETSPETNPERERGAPPPSPIESFTIDDALHAWLAAECAQEGLPLAALNVARETAIWRDDHRRRGTCPANAVADWRIWMRRAIAYARRHPPPPPPEVPYAGPAAGSPRLDLERPGPPPPGPAGADGGNVAADFLAAVRAAARARGVPG